MEYKTKTLNFVSVNNSDLKVLISGLTRIKIVEFD